MFLPAAPPIPTAEDLRAELSPAGILQHFLVDQIALSMDRLAARDEPAPMREQTQVERSFYKVLTEFRRLVKAASKPGQTAPPPGSRCMPSWSGATPPSTAAGYRWCR